MQSSSKKGRGWEIVAGYEKGMRMKRHKIRKKRNPGWYFLLPEFLGVSVFGLIPFADVVRRSFFQTVDGSFVGISNYVQVIKNDAFNLSELLRGFANYRMLIYAIVLIIMMLFNWAPAARDWRARMVEKFKGKKEKKEVA